MFFSKRQFDQWINQSGSIGVAGAMSGVNAAVSWIVTERFLM